MTKSKIIKNAFFTAILALLITIFPTVTTYSNDNVTVVFEGEQIAFTGGQNPVIIEGRTLVPIRDVFEFLGFEVDWSAETRTAIIENAYYIILITADEVIFSVNGAAHSFDVPAQIMNGRVLVPIRLPLESVGFTFDWDGAARAITIFSPTGGIAEAIIYEPTDDEQDYQPSSNNQVDQPANNEQFTQPTSSRMGQWSSIQIIGDANFTQRAEAALNLIRTETPDMYEWILHYMGVIRQYSRSGMWWWLDPPEYRIGTPTYTSSTIWLATTIVHDALHALQAYYEPETFLDPNSQLWYDAEMDAVRMQIEFLRRINAPQHYITHSENMMLSPWWLGDINW